MTREEIFDIIYGDDEDFESVSEEKIEDQSRWSIYKSLVFKQKSTGKFFWAYWGEGATEYQDGQEEYCSLTEVEPYEVTVTRYKEVKNGTQYEG